MGVGGGAEGYDADVEGVRGPRSVSEPDVDAASSSSSASSQESARAWVCCFLRKAGEDLEGCGLMESLVREDSRSGDGLVWCSSFA